MSCVFHLLLHASLYTILQIGRQFSQCFGDTNMYFCPFNVAKGSKHQSQTQQTSSSDREH